MINKDVKRSTLMNIEIERRNGQWTKKRTDLALKNELDLIRLVIFENLAENGKRWHNISITRSYRSGTEWKETATFNGEGNLAKWYGRFSPGWIDSKPPKRQRAPRRRRGVKERL